MAAITAPCGCMLTQISGDEGEPSLNHQDHILPLPHFFPLEAAHQSSWDLHPKHGAQVFAANVYEPQKSPFPGIFGPGSFSGVYV